MVYLIAKFTLLFLATALLGVLLGRWSVRRRLVDVSETFESLTSARSAEGSFWSKVWPRLDELEGSIAPKVKSELYALPKPDAVDLAPLNERMKNLEDVVSNIRIPEPDLAPLSAQFQGVERSIKAIPVPRPVDFAPVNERLNTVEQAIAGIRIPELPKPVDLEPMNSRIRQLEQAIKAIPVPQPVDLEPMSSRIRQLDQAIKAIPVPQPVDFEPTYNRIGQLGQAIKSIPTPSRVDLAPVTERLSKLETAVGNIRIPEPAEAVDLAPVNTRIERVERQLQAMPRPQSVDLTPLSVRIGEVDRAVRSLPGPAPALDIAPVNDRLIAIEEQLQRLIITPEVVPESVPEVLPSVAPVAPVTPGPRLLDNPIHGERDNLKRISGVGPKLERLLNDNGVYYFWQVASWDAEDVQFIDDRLEVFPGRIERDDWVSQASRLKNEPGAAVLPS